MERFTEDKRLTKRLLDIIIELSDEEGYTQTELIKRTGIGKTIMSKHIKSFEHEGITHCEADLKKSEQRGTGTSIIYYYLGPKDAKPEENLDKFRLILESSIIALESGELKRLLASEYVNSIIEKCGIKSVYEILEEHINNKEFRGIASETLLNQPALIDEYIKLPELMRAYVNLDGNRINDLVFYLRNTKYLEFLFKLDIIDSIKFYREYLAKPFGELYRDLTTKEDIRAANPYVTEGIRRFLELDLFLSPVTSFPMNSPVDLLFAKPFERLYDDVYICDNSDYETMVFRAYIIYSNFAEVLRLGILSVRYEEDHWERMAKFLAKSDESYLETKKFDFMRSLRRDLFSNKQNLGNLIKELIFYWNIASLRLDFIYCKQRYWKKRWGGSSAGYHLLANSNGIQAIDIDDNRTRPGPEMTREDMIITSLWSGDFDPFSNLRYCYCFKDLNLEEKQVSIEEIASALENI